MGRARPCWTQALEFSSLVGSCLEVNVVLVLGPRFLHFGVLAAVILCETLEVLAAMKICWDKEEAKALPLEGHPWAQPQHEETHFL